MNIQTVIANLLNTIEGKEKMLADMLQKQYTLQQAEARALSISMEFVEINIKELKNILADCMAVREADIVKDLEMKELKRQNSEYGWMVSPDRMGQ